MHFDYIPYIVTPLSIVIKCSFSIPSFNMLNSRRMFLTDTVGFFINPPSLPLQVFALCSRSDLPHFESGSSLCDWNCDFHATCSIISSLAYFKRCIIGTIFSRLLHYVLAWMQCMHCSSTHFTNLNISCRFHLRIFLTMTVFLILYYYMTSRKMFLRYSHVVHQLIAYLWLWRHFLDTELWKWYYKFLFFCYFQVIADRNYAVGEQVFLGALICFLFPNLLGSSGIGSLSFAQNVSGNGGNQLVCVCVLFWELWNLYICRLW